jgi:hypothetical protein
MPFIRYIYHRFSPLILELSACTGSHASALRHEVRSRNGVRIEAYVPAAERPVARRAGKTVLEHDLDGFQVIVDLGTQYQLTDFEQQAMELVGRVPPSGRELLLEYALNAQIIEQFGQMVPGFDQISYVRHGYCSSSRRYQPSPTRRIKPLRSISSSASRIPRSSVEGLRFLGGRKSLHHRHMQTTGVDWALASRQMTAVDCRPVADTASVHLYAVNVFAFFHKKPF